MNKVEFIRVMKILLMSYGKEFDSDTLEVWYMQLGNLKIETFEKTIKNIIRKNKFMPSIAEILEVYEEERAKDRILILENMKATGYFKNDYEYEKACKFLSEGIMPSWFKEEMNNYYKQNKLMCQQKLLNE